MTERVIMRLWVYACPEGQRPAAVAVLEGLERHLLTPTPGTLNLRDSYVDERFAPADTVEAGRIAFALAGAAPGVSFLMKADADACNPGIIRAYTPELGHYEGEINGNREVVLAADRIQEIITPDPGGDRPGHLTRVRNSLKQACGTAWVRDFDAREHK